MTPRDRFPGRERPRETFPRERLSLVAVPDIDEPVHLSAYDPRWPVRYAREATRIREALAGLAVAVEHIGSTAVPGLIAKPIVDVMVGVAATTPRDAVARALVPLGYDDCGEVAPGRRYLRRRGGEPCNVHVMAYAGALWEANLRFREQLRAHPEAARRYAEAKRAAVAAAPMLLAYSKLKDDLIAELLAER
jgi:GrpB-like predicted nucleotidyltransferase (UPF0157 family)